MLSSKLDYNVLVKYIRFAFAVAGLRKLQIRQRLIKISILLVYNSTQVIGMEGYITKRVIDLALNSDIWINNINYLF